MNNILKICALVAIMGIAPMTWACDADDSWGAVPGSGDIPAGDRVAQATYGENPQSKGMSELMSGAQLLLTVNSSEERGDSESEQKYKNNLDSTKENRNKMRVNSATQIIGVGQRAVALARDSGKDAENLRKGIENRDDVLSMLKNIAKLQAQSLQKTNAITAMRAKLAELSALESIISGDIYTTQTSVEQGTASSGNTQSAQTTQTSTGQGTASYTAPAYDDYDECTSEEKC